MRKRSDIGTHEPTRYEVALMRDRQPIAILGYTARKSKQGILNLLTTPLEHHLTAEELEQSDKHTATYSAKFGLTITDRISIGFTGKTEREQAKNHANQ